MHASILKLGLLLMTLIALGVAVLYAVHRHRFPIALEICETSTGRCSYSALFRNWESCMVANDRSNLYCDDTGGEQIVCRRGDSSISTSRCLRQ